MDKTANHALKHSAWYFILPLDSLKNGKTKHKCIFVWGKMVIGQITFSLYMAKYMRIIVNNLVFFKMKFNAPPRNHLTNLTLHCIRKELISNGLDANDQFHTSDFVQILLNAQNGKFSVHY